jgi:Protein of unknown function (DUF402)
MTWPPGTTAVLQEVWNGRVWAARPVRVVRDEGDFVALWFPKGTRWKAPTTPPTRPRERTRGERLATTIALGDWVFADAEWEVSTLMLLREGEWHALWISWLDDGEQWGWYVNLQRPFRRTPLGFETMDLMLDVTIELDRSWRWKDEDELEVFVERGVFDEALAGRLREEGLEVARRAERNEGPFAEDWSEWRPAASMPPPELPPGWDEPCR